MGGRRRLQISFSLRNRIHTIQIVCILKEINILQRQQNGNLLHNITFPFTLRGNHAIKFGFYVMNN